MTPDPIIRDAGTGDAAAIASILNALLTTTTIEWTEVPWTAASAADWLAEHETVLVAEDRGEVIGVAAYGWFRDAVRRTGYRFTVENTVHVRQDHVRAGVGRALMRVLIDRARESGKHVMVAVVDGENDISIRFHERLGFSRAAHLTEVGAKFGKWLDLVILQLRLDAEAAPRDAAPRGSACDPNDPDGRLST